MTPAEEAIFAACEDITREDEARQAAGEAAAAARTPPMPKTPPRGAKNNAKNITANTTTRQKRTASALRSPDDIIDVGGCSKVKRQSPESRETRELQDFYLRADLGVDDWEDILNPDSPGGRRRACKLRMQAMANGPDRKRTKIYGDRFIPNREGIDLVSTFKLLDDETSPSVTPKKKKRDQYTPLDYQATEEADRQYSLLLRNEIFGDTVPQRGPNHRDAVYKTRAPDPDQHMNLHRCDTPDTLETATYMSTPMTPHKNMFQYMSPRHVHLTGNAQAPTPKKTPRRGDPNMDPEAPIYNLSPIRLSSQQMLLAPRYKPRQVDSQPFRVLDAPDLADDYYLNLIDWGTDGCLAVGLGRSVYLWNAETQKVNKLCKLESGDTVTSVSWIQKGSHIAVGTNKGMVQIWDAARTRRLRTMTGHTGRVGSLAWNDHILSTGSRDKTIYHRDVRQPEQFLRKLSGHKQEICGLRWNAQDGQLASGGNDNKLVVWDKLEEKPLWEFTEHTAAVKAVAWSPHQRGLLASGGGTADRRILFHNTKTGELINEIDTGSQVCNLAWSKNSNEIVSTHGYSQNQIIIWKYPSMKQVCTLVGHTYRVLYLAMSPDGTTIVTGAGDETLRFWKAFQEKQQKGAGVGMDFDNVGMMGHGHIIR